MNAMHLVHDSSENTHVLEESEILTGTGNSYWHSSFLDTNGFPISGGFGPSKNVARQIATAEYLERKFYRTVRSQPDLSKKWGCEIIPTACGFAVGFDKANTLRRSIYEAAERWVMSQWIDSGRYIERIECNSELDEASTFFKSHFEETWFFKKNVRLHIDNRVFEFDVVQTLGFLNGGVFPGSSAQSINGNLWQHALLESFRHLQAFNNNPPISKHFAYDRLMFFGKNARVAIDQIEAATNRSWPTPKIRFHFSEFQNEKAFYVSRTIFDGWNSWHSGPISRFVY